MGRKPTQFSANHVPSLSLQSLPKKTDSVLDHITGYVHGSFQMGFHKLSSLWSTPRVETAKKAPSSIDERFEDLESQISTLYKKLKPLDEKVVSLRSEKKRIPPDITKTRIKIKEDIDDLLCEKVEISAELIKWHAQRRVDLFLYQLIAVHGLIAHYQPTLEAGKTMLLKRGETTLQHGKGTKAKGTAACHASLFPCLAAEIVDKHEDADSYLDKASAIISGFVTGMPQSQEEREEDDLPGDVAPEEPAPKEKTVPFLLDNSYFQDVCNLTHEGPMNPFDCVLEKKNRQKSPMVEKAEAITNAVFHGEISPLKGLKLFGFHMKLFFDYIHYNYLIKEIDYKPLNPTVPYPKSFKKIWALQKEATLSSFEIAEEQKDSRIKYPYLHLMLELDSVSGLRKTANLPLVIEEQMDKLQNEILSSPSYRASKEEEEEIKARAFSP